MDNTFSLSDLINLARYTKNEPQTEEEKEAYERVVSRVAALDTTFHDATEELSDMLKNTPVLIDNETATQMINELLPRGEGEKKLYQILLDDMMSAYMVIKGQLKESYMDWEKDYILKDIDVNIFTEDGEWQTYAYNNEFDNLSLPGCSSAIMPICLRFRKQLSEKEQMERSWANEIRYVDVLCLSAVKPFHVKRVQMVTCSVVSSMR